MDKTYGAPGLSKADQLHYTATQSKEDADKQAKLAFACLWLAWVNETWGYTYIYTLDFMPLCENTKQKGSLKDLQLDHIKNKTQTDRFDLTNMQLLTPETHKIKTDSGKYTDYRPIGYVNWLKEKLK